MPIIDQVGRRHWRIRILIFLMYVILAVLGVTMVYPFLMTLTAAVSTPLDYQRFAPFPRALWSRNERFVRALVPYFPENMRGGMPQFAHLFHNVQGTWTTWNAAGADLRSVDRFAEEYLAQAADPARWEQICRMVKDYDAFAQNYPLDDSICAYVEQQVGPFFRERYMAQVRQAQGNKPLSRTLCEQRALQRLNERWQLPFENFNRLLPRRELVMPWDQRSFFPPDDDRERDFILLRQAYRDRTFVPNGIRSKWQKLLKSPPARAMLGLPENGQITLDQFNRVLGTAYHSWRNVPFPVTSAHPPALQRLWAYYTGTVVPACETRPFPMKVGWLKYLSSVQGRKAIGVDEGGPLTIKEYNLGFGTSYTDLRETPFPVPDRAPAKMRQVWEQFVQTQYPLRLTELRATPEMVAQFRSFVKTRFLGKIELCNRALKTSYRTWDDIGLTVRRPADNEALGSLWMEFTDSLPTAAKIPFSAESAWQQFLTNKYGTLEEINRQYGWNLREIEQAQMPFDMACLVSFVNNEWPLFSASLSDNYLFVLDYLVLRGRAVWNTFVLILLSLVGALTVNPLAAYALSRFKMRQTSAIIIFLLATMAFPAAVTVIPGFLLMRDLHLLNTYAALILPGIANGMGIFLLKGFFDSLPPELYEAATIDGAREWQIFLYITFPLCKPILAVIALGNFIAAYNSWEWALVVCQKQEMWTLAVWLYQFSDTWKLQPWSVMAAFVLASIPVFVVFMFCQKIILRGIILPQMK